MDSAHLSSHNALLGPVCGVRVNGNSRTDHESFASHHQPRADHQWHFGVGEWQTSLPTSPDARAWKEIPLDPARTAKSRHNLQLPPFRLLGIAVPHPDFLLTPPEDPESNIQWKDSPKSPTRISTTFPIQNPPRMLSEGLSPRTPTIHDFVLAAGNEDPPPLHPTPSSPPAPISNIQEGDGQPLTLDDHSHDREPLLEDAVEVAASSISAGTSAPYVINVLCHTQPCALSEDVLSSPTAFTNLITTLQSRLEAAQGRYIEVTHALPLKFNMARLPTSPVTTPNVATSAGGDIDYFNMNVFSKAVIAVDYHAANSATIPTSPHPVVAPSSVRISLLERFIPPSTPHEYLDLFTTDRPSVLADRLVELSPDNGSLIFIYPTAFGASTFLSKYLGPLLDPLLRTMVGIHELSADVSAEIGKMAVIEHMLPFENMVRRIRRLLRLKCYGVRGSSPSTYTLAHSSKQTVQLERKVWTEWWIHQETPRIREVMSQYFQRARRLPQSQDTTAGSLVREIIHGVETRFYGEFDASREGVEVGVFVIKRTA